MGETYFTPAKTEHENHAHLHYAAPPSHRAERSPIMTASGYLYATYSGAHSLGGADDPHFDHKLLTSGSHDFIDSQL